MSLIKDLEYILNHLKILNRPVINKLQKGIGNEKLNELIRNNSLFLPEAVIELFKWRNGTGVNEGDILDSLHFFPGFYWLSMEDALSSYKAFVNDDHWDKNWFPIFANGGGDFYAVIQGKSDQFGSIVGFMLGESDQLVEYKSIGSMIRTIRLCFNENVFFVSHEGYLESDDFSQFRIAKQLNEGLEFYK